MTDTTQDAPRLVEELDPQLVTDLLRYKSEEDHARWAMGYRLVEANLSEAALVKLAIEIDMTANTLRVRKQVAHAFPEGTIDLRHSWSVYRELLRYLGTFEERMAILATRDRWTVDSISMAVREQKKLDRGETGESIGPDSLAAPGSPRTRFTNALGAAKVFAELLDPTRMRLTIEGSTSIVESSIRDGSVVIVCAIADA